ncbi:hypothetical protein GCM10010329_44250 [Streptomyces spiroverticillatus]|uniref:Uncharacterized protein n=1 Tax=Streptomyces finlayi TaxID=67296 RepID=A0A919CBB3_9ACTN|nr:hypothetical protein [Streptomyces finlayi]GHA16515.1 hypothetical protein GCM10010329_44250 [Streptomyces spiroverticillatus]GHC98704.1 hypothetical protein GCM10010334_41430 [Streptomyces finlayi]
MEALSALTPREAGALVTEPQVSFANVENMDGAVDKCPFSICFDSCFGTGYTG